jgi:zinc protease
LSYSVGSGLSIPDKDDNASFTVYAISAPQNAPKVEAIVREELEQAVRDGFTAEEVNTAKKAWLDLRLTQRAQDSSLLSSLSAREKYDRTMKWDEQVEARVAALTQEQVNSAFRRLIIPANLSVVQAGDFAKAGVYQAKK